MYTKKKNNNKCSCFDVPLSEHAEMPASQTTGTIQMTLGDMYKCMFFLFFLFFLYGN